MHIFSVNKCIYLLSLERIYVARFAFLCRSIDCRARARARERRGAFCLRKFSTARRRRHATERDGNPFYIVVDAAEEYIPSRENSTVRAFFFFIRRGREENPRVLHAAYRGVVEISAIYARDMPMNKY